MSACPPIIADIARDCIQFDPSLRPTANDIAERLARWHFREMDLNRDEDGNTLLHQAVKSRDEKKLDELLESDDVPVMINAVNHAGETALQLAEDSAAFFEKLLRYKKVPLDSASPSRLPECSHNINVNARDGRQRTPLHIASKKNYHEAVPVLFERSEIDVNARDDEQRTPLHLASYWNAHEVVALLLERSDVDVTALDSDGKTSLDLALERDAAECTELLGAALRLPVAASSG